jgi:hypothetical protein
LRSVGELPNRSRYGRLGTIRCAIIELDLSIRFVLGGLQSSRTTDSEKKAGVVEHPWVFDHAGLLVIGPPGSSGLPFI